MPASGIAVRAALPADLSDCVALAAAERSEDPDAARKRFEADLAGPDRRLFVATLDGAFAGYGRVAHLDPSAPPGYYVLGLLVPPAFRRRGVGLALTRTRMRWVFERAAEVWGFANARNRASLDLHARLGFTEVTRDFAVPGVAFEGGVGVLFRALRPAARPPSPPRSAAARR